MSLNKAMMVGGIIALYHIIKTIKRKVKRYRKMKKFTYGFATTKQERNTINRQINRMEKRGYIFPKDIRNKITTTKDLPKFLYEHSVYQPFVIGEKRVRWQIPGTLGHEAERAVDKINRENKRLVKKGIKTEYHPVKTSGIGGLPGPWVPSFFKKKEATINREAEEATKKFIEKAKRPMEERLTERFNKDREHFLNRLEDLLKTYITFTTDIKERRRMIDEIKTRVRSFSIKEWLNFERTTTFEFRIWMESKTTSARLTANLESLLNDLDIAITPEYRAIIDDLMDALLMHSEME